MKHTEETYYPQGIAGYAIVGIYTGDSNSPPWVGPVKPTRKETADAYYVRACEYRGIDPAANPADDWHTQLISAKVMLEEREDIVLFDAGDEQLAMVKIPL